MLASALLYMCEYYTERAILANVCLIQNFKTSRNSTTAGRTHDTLGKGDAVAIMREYTRASHCSAALCRPTWGCGCWGVYWRGSV